MMRSLCLNKDKYGQKLSIWTSKFAEMEPNGKRTIAYSMYVSIITFWQFCYKAVVMKQYPDIEIFHNTNWIGSHQKF